MAIKAFLRAASVGALMIIAFPSQAATVVLHYSGSSLFGPLPLSSANLVLTTSDTLNGFGGYDVLGVSGDVDGDLVTGLAPTEPSVFRPPPLLGSCINGAGQQTCTVNQTYFPSAPYFDNFGLAFQSTGNLYNIFSPGGPTTLLVSLPVGSPFIEDLRAPPPPWVSFSAGEVTAIPEPATWLMMILGFGFIGMAIRKARRTQTCAA